MAVKYFCDVCGKEAEQFDRVRRSKGRVGIEVMVRFDSVWNSGHICPACVVDVVQNGTPEDFDKGYVATENRKRAAA